MNIELIKKYKKEFDNWLEDKSSIIMGYNKSKTLEIEWLDFIDWNFDSGIFILNDEYVELRKALAEGKILQLNESEKFGDPKRGWVDLSCTDLGHSRYLFPAEYYRIKPEESKIPKFKVGDWVVEYGNILLVINITDEGYWCKTEENDYSDYELKNAILWKPQVGEVHWFARTKDEEPVLGKFVETSHWKNIITYKIHTELDSTVTCSYFEYCEPFIGTLPTKWRNK